MSASMVVADRTVHIRAQDAEGCICIVKNAIGEAEIILTRRLKQFRLDKIEVSKIGSRYDAPRLSHG